MGDAGEGLIDAQARMQERMDERDEERARRASRLLASQDPEAVRRAESLRLAHTELSRQLASTTHAATCSGSSEPMSACPTRWLLGAAEARIRAA